MTGNTVFNNPIESAIRSLVLLVEAYPRTLDLQQLVYLDYLLVHSDDAGGPASLHPATPQRYGEIAVRRNLIEQGLNLLLVRGLVARNPTKEGFAYAALDGAGGIIASLATPYSQQLRERGRWVTTTFADRNAEWLNGFLKEQFGRWSTEFALTSPGWEEGE
jgi:hypothetical protein